MGISLRDEKGQAIVEYILVLVVSVTILMGGIYQLNSAFKTWANNYFGNYLACLLETGELPTISGTGGDSGLCNQFFKPFSLADGRPLAAKGKGSGGGDSTPQTGGGTRESSGGAGGGGGGGGGGRVGSFNGGKNFGAKGAGAGAGKTNKMDSSYTGNTSASGYGSYSGSNRNRSSSSSRTHLDQKFAFDETREKQERRSVASSSSKPSSEGKKEARASLNSKSKKVDGVEGDDGSGFSFGDLLRYLIIAGIIIAILVFLGGQGLQIGKSME